MCVIYIYYVCFRLPWNENVNQYYILGDKFRRTRHTAQRGGETKNKKTQEKKRRKDNNRCCRDSIINVKFITLVGGERGLSHEQTKKRIISYFHLSYLPFGRWCRWVGYTSSSRPRSFVFLKCSDSKFRFNNDYILRIHGQSDLSAAYGGRHPNNCNSMPHIHLRKTISWK